MIELQWVETTDVVVMGTRRLDLTKFPIGSVIALGGFNGAGKSTMMECSLPGALFGFLPSREPSGNETRGGKLADVALSRKAKVAACYHIHGSEYVFQHLLDGAKGKWEPWIYQDGKALVAAGLTSNGKVKVFKAQVDYLLGGATWDLLSASVFWTQGGGGSFAYLKEAEARSLFARMIGAEKYGPLEAETKGLLRTAKAILADLDGKTELVAEALKEDQRRVIFTERIDTLDRHRTTLTSEAEDIAEIAAQIAAEESLGKRVSAVKESLEWTAKATKSTDEGGAAFERVQDLERELAAARSAASKDGAGEKLERRTELEADVTRLEAALGEAKTAYDDARTKAIAARGARSASDAAKASWHERYRQHSDQVRRREFLAVEIAKLKARLAGIGEVEVVSTDAISSRLTMCRTEAASATARAKTAAAGVRSGQADLGRARQLAGQLGQTSCRGRDAVDAETGLAYSACPLIASAVDAAGRDPDLCEAIAGAQQNQAAAEASANKWGGLASLAETSLAQARSTAALAVEASDARTTIGRHKEELARLDAGDPGDRPGDAPDPEPLGRTERAAATLSDGLASELAAARRELTRLPSADDLRAVLAGDAPSDARSIDEIATDLATVRESVAVLREAAAAARARAAQPLRNEPLGEDEEVEDLLRRLEAAHADLVAALPDDADYRDLEDVQSEIDEADEEAQEVREERAAAAGKVKALLKAAGLQEEAGEAAARLSSELDEARAEVAELTRLYRAMGPKGIPAMLIERAGPWIGERATDLLAGVTGSPRFNVRLVTREEYAKGNGLKDTFKILVQDNTKTAADGQPLERQLLNYSGGEKSILDSALRVGIAAYMRDLGGLDWRTVSADELGGAFDEDRGPAWVEMCKEAVTRFGLSHQLLISHSADVRAACDYIVEISSL